MATHTDRLIPFAFAGEMCRDLLGVMLSQQIMWNDWHRALIFRTLSQFALLDMSNVSTRMLYATKERSI